MLGFRWYTSLFLHIFMTARIHSPLLLAGLATMLSISSMPLFLLSHSKSNFHSNPGLLRHSKWTFFLQMFQSTYLALRSTTNQALNQVHRQVLAPSEPCRLSIMLGN
jgi:hypothetical protein